MPDTIPTPLVTAAFGGMGTAMAALATACIILWRRLNERDDQQRIERKDSEDRIAAVLDTLSGKMETMTAALVRVTTLLEARKP